MTEVTLTSLVLLPVGVGLLGFIEPCSIGSTLIVVKHLEEISPDDRRPQYSGYMNVLVAPSRVLPLLAGVFDYEDGELSFRGPELAATATRLIRAEQPHLVLTHDPFMGSPRYANYQLHPDHRAVGSAVLDAVYFRAPGPLYHSEQITGGLRTHRVGELWLIMGDHADHAVDIGGTVDRKIAAVRAHVSQWGQHPDLEGLIRRRAEAVGVAPGLPLAEAFKRLRPS